METDHVPNPEQLTGYSQTAKAPTKESSDTQEKLLISLFEASSDLEVIIPYFRDICFYRQAPMYAYALHISK